MDYTRSSLLNLNPYFCHGKSVEELGQSWLCTAVELESLRMQAEEEIRRRDEQLSQVKDLLFKAMKERDEAIQKCQTLHVERLLQQKQNQLEFINVEPGKDPDSSECDESIVSSSSPIQLKEISNLQSFNDEVMQRLMSESNHALPEKGKFLQAVLKAGPLLETLLLAGPLPKWRQPPPPLGSFEIPPVIINNNNISRKRGLPTSDCSDSSTETRSYKLQKQHI